MATADPAAAAPCPPDLAEEIALLWSLVATPSISGSEAAVAQQIVAWAEAQGLSPVCDDTSLRIELVGREAGPALAMVSHLDVVPPGAGWTRDPFAPALEAGCSPARVFRRGGRAWCAICYIFPPMGSRQVRAAIKPNNSEEK